jgi:hypothetical protein
MAIYVSDNWTNILEERIHGYKYHAKILAFLAGLLLGLNNDVSLLFRFDRFGGDNN